MLFRLGNVGKSLHSAKLERDEREGMHSPQLNLKRTKLTNRE